MYRHRKLKKQTSEKKAESKKPLANSLLWEVSGNGLAQPSYLFGTYHLLNHGYLDTTPEVKKSFNASKGVVVETELDSPAMKQLGVKMVMTDNKLSLLLTPEELALVGKEVKQAMGYDIAALEQLKPMTLMLMLSMMEYQKLEILKPYKGKVLDAYFAEQGRADGKKITHLETMEQQFDLLYSHFPLEKQARQLVEYVEKKETFLKLQEHLTNLYFEKNLEAMWTTSEEYNKLMGEEDMSYIVDDRNKNWMKQLPGLMKTQATFVAVGAMHLPGENGLIRLLQKAGYTVKPLQ